MSTAISWLTGARYGIKRVCEAWEQPRSTYYARMTRIAHPAPTTTPKQKRGPKTVLSDDALLTAIHQAIQQSPFSGEGYRKIWFSLRHGPKRLHIGPNRVLRLMRQHKLLSPYRRRPAPRELHDRTITTNAPNVMWGTDGTQVLTVEDGYVWVFSAVEHWRPASFESRMKMIITCRFTSATYGIRSRGYQTSTAHHLPSAIKKGTVSPRVKLNGWASHPASASWKSLRLTGWLNGSIGHSKSKRSMAVCFVLWAMCEMQCSSFASSITALGGWKSWVIRRR